MQRGNGFRHGAPDYSRCFFHFADTLDFIPFAHS